ncbi:hypothetical protein [Streptomyces orinoci]|uniref:Transposase n=1 Tax=Streptomyces orinoci TaxID=67339 RepID=A0ABV3K356_STRON|nr:hypothetical protein [Streptomyces orinoci]
MTRSVVVRRLLALDEAGTLQTVHVRIAAQMAGVNVRTMWRWLAVAKESGRVGTRTAAGWVRVHGCVVGPAGGVGREREGVARWMTEHADQVLSSLGRDRLPSLTTLHEAVH